MSSRVLATLALACACTVTEHKVHVRMMSSAEAADVDDCNTACADPEADSVNFCTVVAAPARPYLVCEMEVQTEHGATPQSWQVGVPFPDGLDPTTTRGTVDTKWCPQFSCVSPVQERMGRVSRATVTACRVAPRPQVLASMKYLVCSLRYKTDASAALQ